MIKDPIAEEIRKHRDEHVEAYGHDIKRITAALREREAKSQRPVLNPGPKYLPKKIENQHAHQAMGASGDMVAS